ncbi:MAG: transglutaminase-like cysteine peptidase [Pseudomonadales bacterium]|nr:transglutaminase-like cysteine peptidase [Pseudomonadales bacterium]
MSRLLTVLGLTIVVVACGSPAIVPSPAKDYALVLLHKTDHDFAAVWIERMDSALENLLEEETEMERSDEPHVVRWRNSIEHLRYESELIQAMEVNRLVNAEVHYESDYEHWQRLDRWGEPFETLVEGGDCEDFAILKMESLKHLGWDEEQFAVLVGFSNFFQPAESHAVLMATMKDGSQLVMDSLEDAVEPPSEEHHFSALYAVTRDHLFMVGVPANTNPVASVAAGRTRAQLASASLTTKPGG